MNLVRVFQPNRRREVGAVGAASAGMDPRLPPEKRKPRRRAPRLDRRNAVKNIDYEAGDADSDESVRRGGCDSAALRTRSLDIPPSAVPSVYFASQTSFRIGGEVEGEFDMLCRNLGLSGPEDFAITPDDWAEANRGRSPPEVPGRSIRVNPIAEAEDSSSPPPPEEQRLPQLQQPGTPEEDGLGALLERFRLEVSVADDVPETVSKPRFPTNIVGAGGGGGGGGIKGTRPPFLAPPPSMTLPTVDKMSSTWDLFRALAPDDSHNVSGADEQRADSSSESEEDEDSEELEVEEDPVGNSELENDKGARVGVTSTDLVDSCSFWTSNDDDSSSTTTEGMYVISPNSKLRRNIGSWMKGRQLGSGSFGTVFEAISDDGFFFAVKEVSLLDQGTNAEQCIHQLEQEIALLSQFEHENIVQYLGTDKEEAKLYIFLELVTQGSLASLYQKYNLRDSQVSAYTRQILNGLSYLHERNVVHRDIKCANILVDANGSVKLADFGLAKETTKLNVLKSTKGSVYWMAPEVVQPRSYGPPADIWSLGCTVLEMLTRQLPYPNLEWTQALFLIGRGGQPTVPSSLSRDARDFIDQCIQVDPDARPSASKLLEHPFVKRPFSTPLGSDSSTHNNERRTWLAT